MPGPDAVHREDHVGATYLATDPAESVPAAAGGVHNVPAELTSFIGRRRELAHVKAAIAGVRLLTLTGPGGVGKTRLARRSAAALERSFDDGVWLVELDGIEDAALLAQSVAGALDLRDESGRWPVAMLTDHLASRRLLLVLDNCEHLLEACAVLCDALLRACSQLRILATSRQPLGVEGETTLAVPPLSVAQSGRELRSPGRAAGDAAELFAQRAAAALPGFTVTAENVAMVAEVCRRLDGIPLAIELAAARLRALTVEQILDRLDDRLRLLTGGGRAGLPRQRTLRATVEWSHDLLCEQERVLWRRLAAFPASFALDAAEAVCAGGSLPAGEVVSGVADLTEKSMLVRDGPRHRLLETLRAYARERLRDAGEERDVSRAHRDWCGELAARARREWTGTDQVQWFDRLAAEHASVRAALEFSLSEPGEAERGLVLACDLWLYWQARGHLGEGRRWLRALLELAPEATTARARGLWVAGFLALTQRDAQAAEEVLAEGLALAGQLGSECDVAFASQYLGLAALFRGDTAAAVELLRRAVDLHRRVDEPAGAFALADLALVTMLRGERAPAEALFEDSIAWAAASGDRWTRSHALWGLGMLALDDGRTDLARDLQSEALSLTQALDERTGIALCVEALAWVAGACGQAERAARLIGATHVVWESIPSSLPGVMSARHEACEHRARSRLGTAAFERALRAGAALSREAAVAYGRGRRGSGEPPRRPLKGRQRERGPTEQRLVGHGGLCATGDRARQQQLALGVVVAQVGRARELLARLGQPPQADEEVAAHAGQQVVAAQRGLVGERVDELEPGLRAEGHHDRHGAVELDDRGAGERRQGVVQRDDPRPVGLLDAAGPRVAGGDRGLQRVRAQRAAELLGALQPGQAALYEQVVPACAVLVGEQHRLAVRPDPRPQPRGLQLHQGQQAVDLGLARHQRGEDAPQAQGVLAQRRPDPVLAGGCGVALVEDQVDHLEHRRQTVGQLIPAGDLERHAGLGERALGADDALRDGPLGDEERSGDLRRRKAAEQAQRQRDARLLGQDRVAGHEDQAQDVVLHVVDLRGEVGLVELLEDLQLAPDQLLLALERDAAAQGVDAPALGGGHEPGTRVVRDARLRPLLQCGDERVLGQVLGHRHVAGEPSQPGDQPGRLDPPDGVDRTMGGRRRHRLVLSGGLLAHPLLALEQLGVSCSPKSCASKIGRSSSSTPPSNGARLSHSIASSRDAHSQTQ